MSTDNASKGVTSRLPKWLGPFKWLLLPLVILVMPAYELGKDLSDKAYSKQGLIGGIFNAMFGFGLSVLAFIATSGGLGTALGLSSLIWFPAACIAFLVTAFIAYPGLFLVLLKPTGEKLEKFFKATREFFKKNAKDFFGAIVGFAKHLPGSAKLWNFVENNEKGRWVGGFLGFLTGAGVVGLAGTVAYTLYHLVIPFLPAALLWGWAAPAVAGFVAGVGAIAIVGVLIQLLEFAELYFVAPALTVAAIYAGFGLTEAGVAALGLPALSVWGAVVVEFILGVAYLYPGLHALLKTGIIKSILDGVKWLMENTYGEKDKDFRKFFHHVTSIVAGFIGGGLVFWAFAFYGVFPLPVSILAGVIGLVSSYIASVDALEDGPGTILVGLIAAVATAVGTYWFAPHANVPDWLFYTALVLQTALAFCVVIPGLYQLFRLATNGWLAKPAGAKLASWHDSAKKQLKALKNWWNEKVIKPSYDDKTPYRELFLHLFNLTILGVGVWKAIPLASGWLGLPGWAITTLLVISGFTIYNVVGKILLEGGVAVAGFALGFGAFAHVGWQLYSVDHGYWWLAVMVASTVASIVTYIAAPVAYLFIKIFANPLLGWSRFIWVGLFDFFWGISSWFWNLFWSVYKVFHENVVLPVVHFFGAMIKAMGEIWDSIRGKK